MTDHTAETTRANLGDLVRLIAVRVRITASSLGNSHNPGLYPDTDTAVGKLTSAIGRTIAQGAPNRYARARLDTALDTIINAAAARERSRIFAEAAGLITDEDGHVHLEHPTDPAALWMKDVLDAAAASLTAITHDITAHTNLIAAETDRIVQATSDDSPANGTTA